MSLCRPFAANVARNEPSHSWEKSTGGSAIVESSFTLNRLPHWNDFFFLTSAPSGQQYAFRTEPQGDSFRMVEEHQIGSGIAIVGWNWGPDGRLYGANWDGGYPLDQKGAVVSSDAPKADMEIREEVQQLLKQGFRKRTDHELQTLLAHQDQRVRLHSQCELANRDQFEVLHRVASTVEADSVTRVHAIRGFPSR